MVLDPTTARFNPKDEAITLYRSTESEGLKLELLKLIVSFDTVTPASEPKDPKALAAELLEFLKKS